MLTELILEGGLIMGVVGFIINQLKKLPFWKNSWCPYVAPIIGGIILCGLNIVGLVMPELIPQEAMAIGGGFGLAAVGAHAIAARTPKPSTKRER